MLSNQVLEPVRTHDRKNMLRKAHLLFKPILIHLLHQCLLGDNPVSSSCSLLFLDCFLKYFYSFLLQRFFFSKILVKTPRWASTFAKISEWSAVQCARVYYHRRKSSQPIVKWAVVVVFRGSSRLIKYIHSLPWELFFLMAFPSIVVFQQALDIEAVLIGASLLWLA